MTVSGAVVLWTFRSPNSGRTLECTLLDLGQTYDVRLTYAGELPALPETFTTRAAAMAHAAEVAASLVQQGWVEVLPE